MKSVIRNGIAFTTGAVVFYADVVAAFALALLSGVVGAGVIGLPLAFAVVYAAAAGVAVWRIARAVPRSRPLKKRLEEWAERVDDWILPSTPRPAVTPKPVAPLAFTLERAAAGPAPVQESKSTEPRPLKSYELATWKCPWCEQTPVAGTHAWEDRGPFQLLSNHAFTCPDGHKWTNSTDGG
ncbi:hypothetical protein [Streptomyces umbrinus]|uniref:hypothetical protein n=1 Tax=Streptomyces umbrinus TaxID=67370 RepID=UPI0034082A0D